MKQRYGLDDKIERRYRRSIDLFEEAFKDLPEATRATLLYRIIGDCELARKFDWSPEQKTRQADRDAISGSKTASNHARELAKYAGAFPLQVMFALMNSILKTGVHLRTKADDQPLALGVALSSSHATRLSQLLTALADELKQGNLSAKRGPFGHRTRHGPLDYPKPIENNADLPEPPTALAIYLSFLFRTFTLEGHLPHQRGELVPTGGRPHWRVVSQFVEDALGVHGDFKDAARKVLRRHPKLTMWGYRR